MFWVERHIFALGSVGRIPRPMHYAVVRANVPPDIGFEVRQAVCEHPRDAWRIAWALTQLAKAEAAS